MLIARRRRRLDQKDVTATDIFLDFYVGFPIGKGADHRLTQGNADVFANTLSQRAVRGAAEHFHFGLKLKHGGLNWRAGQRLAMIKTCGEAPLPRLVPASVNTDPIRIERPTTD